MFIVSKNPSTGRHGLHLVHENAWEKYHELPINGVRSERQIHRLISKLAKAKQSADRVQYLVYDIKSSPQAFSGDQMIKLAAYFPGTELVLLLHLLDNHLFGLKCDQAAQLLEMISVPEERLEALQVIDENLLDPINRFQLRKLFPSNLLPQVDQILADTRGQSHIYGSITSSRVIFLIDTSSSMNTEFETRCGQSFNRLQYIVHDLHKLLHHRVQPDFKFNIIHFDNHVRHWKNSLTLATPEHLKQAEHYLDHLEAKGQTNTYDALRTALSDEEVDTIYLLSGGEPSMDPNLILSDLKVWLQQRRKSCIVHTIAFLMGHVLDDPKPRKFMAKIAAMTGGVFRCMDAFAPLNQELSDDSYSDDPDFNDDNFVDFFQEKLKDVPTQLLGNVGLKTQHCTLSSKRTAKNTRH